MKVRTILSAFTVSAILSTAACAQVTGTVTLDGKPPVLAPINVAAMAQCAKEHPGGTIPNETVVVGDKGELANVVVSIKKEANPLPVPAKMPEAMNLDQKGCQYVPHVVAVQVDQPLVAKNSDPFLHNVHSQPADNTPINTAQPTIDKKGKKLGTKVAEYYRVKCDVHPWMSAWVAVIDNPYFAVTDKDGAFTLPAGLKDGEYTVIAWHEKFDKMEGKLVVKDGKGEIKLTFKAAGADANKALEGLMPAGVKLAVTATEPCCEVGTAKAALMAKAAAK